MITKKLELESKWAAQALKQGNVTPDMKWMDIDIKKLKVQINEQCVTDARIELKVEDQSSPIIKPGISTSLYNTLPFIFCSNNTSQIEHEQ